MEEIKKPRERSKEYPSYDLKESLELAEYIITKLGNRFSSREQIAVAISRSASTLETKLSACKQFGLLELKKGEGYKPTDLFLKITRGRTDQDKKAALIQSVKSPTIYGDFISKNIGQKIPSDLASILYWDYKITEKAKDDAAKVFIESLNFSNLITPDGILSESDGVETNTEVATPTDNTNERPKFETEKTKPEIRIEETKNKFIPSGQITYDTKEADMKINPGRYVKIIFPSDITNDEIEKIKKNVDTWKD